jgi:ABC-type antimicrobial peptide transport system permease subunit
VSSPLSVEAVASAIRQAVRRIDPDQAIGEVRPMESVVAATMRQQRFMTSLLAAFAGLATVLAAIGVYGVVAMFVSQRRQEFGIRMALGARRSDVLRYVLRQGMEVISTGIAIGIVAAFGLSRLLSSLLFGVTSTEPLSYIFGAAILLVSGLAACFIPARAATQVDPAQSLRSE